MTLRHFFTCIIILLNFPALSQTGTGINIRGIVQDENLKPIEFANVRISGTDEARSTKRDGSFRFNINDHLDSVVLEISFTNKKTESVTIHPSAYSGLQKIVLLNESLTLGGVEVSAVRKSLNSASSIVFDNEAIRQMQAFSLMDVLNNLPGKKTEAPDLQNPQTANFRTNATGTTGMNNSFGIAIFIDGVQITNDANMQSRSINARGVSGSALGGFDVPYNGFDLRDIPLSNIEKIEIIQGVASARYGNLSNGAILITTKAGKSPFTFSVNVNGGSTSSNLSKGFKLGQKAGALNISFGYTNSNNDPRDKVKSFNKVNAGLRWSVDISRQIRNSFSFSFDKNLDNIKADPDDDSERKSYSKRQSFSIANTTRVDFLKGILNSLDVSASYSSGLQDTYNQWLLNGPPRALGGKDTTGAYVGYFIPGNYLAIEHINGKPFSLGADANLDFKPFRTAGLRHVTAIGASFNGSGNKGSGYIVDPDRPRWINVAGQNERPYRYEDSVKLLTSLNFYVQDNISGKLLGNQFRIGLGFRYGLQNGYGSYQPRLSFNYDINKNLNWSASYGISSKAPSLAHRYPAPVYFDVPLLNLYTGFTNSSLYLVYTKKILNQNSYLKPATVAQLETGLQLKTKWGSVSVFGYYKKNKNGFGSFSLFQPFSVPVYRYTVLPSGMIDHYPTGSDSMVYNYDFQKIYNTLPTQDYGLDFMFQTSVIKKLMTYFNLRGGFTKSMEQGDAGTFSEYKVNPDLLNPNDIRYGVYRRQSNQSTSLIISAASNTQIPKIGFIVSILADFTMIQSNHADERNNNPIGYLNSNLELTNLTAEEIAKPEMAFLKRTGTSTIVNSDLPFPYANLSLRVAKEIRKKFRINFSIFNFLNNRPSKYNPINESFTQFNNPISFTAGASIQF